MRKFDQQIVESVALRRQRLDSAVFFGPQRWRRQSTNHVKPLLIGVVLAAVICAGCVATSFVMQLMDRQAQQQRERNAPATSQTHSSPPAAEPSAERRGAPTSTAAPGKR